MSLLVNLTPNFITMNKLFSLFIISSILCFCTISFAQQKPSADVEQITNIYMITPRTETQHLDLSENWQLGWRDNSNKNPDDLKTVNDWINVEHPTSVPIALFKAGKLPDPYKNLNIKQYKWAEQKVWFYKKTFTVSKPEKDGFAFLSFDGLDYYSRVWLNGKQLGKHEGMFGGPEFEVSQFLNFDKPNEIIVTLASANRDNPNYSAWNPGKMIKPWGTSGGTGVEPFFTFGMWRGVRIDFVAKTHLERPFIRTEKISDDHSEAVLIIETEIFSGKHSLQYKLHAWNNHQLIDLSNPSGLLSKDSGKKMELKVRLVHKNQTLEESFPVQIPEGRSWHKRRITLKNPALWSPNGLGAPNLYRCKLELLENGQSVDKIETNIGVRTINWMESAGERIGDRWGNWQCVVNGSPIFIKGINWMPADSLLELPREKLRWRLQLTKNAGIQMIRIWGPGLQETEDFYDLCDELGIMVWQDFPIGNFDTPDWQQEIWEEQVFHTIFRIRNRASLAVWCGGNEFNPYSKGNTASLGIIERNLRLFDNTRKFVGASPDEGSFHAYPDMCPSWYKKLFAAYPFVAETGIHSLSSPYWLREYINPDELPTAHKMWNKEFKNTNPEITLHFVEYIPDRIPRMLSRASHIVDMTSPGIEDLTLATQLGAEEFYQIFSEGIQANYPVTTGLMPWVLARPWPVIAGVQLVDGGDQPLAPYYALKRTYEPQHVLLDIDRLLWKSGENFVVRVKSLNAAKQKGFKGNVSVRIFDDSYKILYDKKQPIEISDGIAVNQVDFEPFTIPNDYKNRYFYVVTELFGTDGKFVSRSVYRPRTIKAMEDSEYFKKFVSAPIAWITLNEGPWLKDTIQKSPKTTLNIKRTEPKPINSRDFEQILTVSNTGNVPCPLVILDIASTDVVVDCCDNYFWLDSGETKTITATIHARDGKESKPLNVNVRSWNVE
jgi:beta-mannosidase